MTTMRPIRETIALDEKQRDFYDGVRLASHRRVRETIEERGLARSQITVLDAQRPQLLFVIPAYNEQENLPALFADLIRTSGLLGAGSRMCHMRRMMSASRGAIHPLRDRLHRRAQSLNPPNG